MNIPITVVALAFLAVLVFLFLKKRRLFRGRRVLIPLVLGALLVGATASGITGTTVPLDLMGGTIWQFGFGAQGISVNGVGGVPGNPMYVDPDGMPYFDMRWATWGHHGTLPGVAVSFDLPGRCDSAGNPVSASAAPEADSEYDVLINSTYKEHYWLYYYSFGYVIKTSAKAYPATTATNPLQGEVSPVYTAWESGTCDIAIAFTVDIRQSIFSNVSAYFADVKILAQHTNIQDITLRDYAWEVTPKCDPIQEVGSRVDITNEIRAGNHYTCTLNARVLLTGGICWAGGVNQNPFDVTFQRKMLMGVLLRQPLSIGHGSTETTTTPTPPAPDYTWVIVVIVVLVIVCLILRRVRRK